MVDFSFDDGQENTQALMHWFAENELRPVALAADRSGRYPDDVAHKMAEIGLGAQLLPKAHAAKSAAPKNLYRSWLIGTEELAWGDPSALLNVPGPGLGAPPVRFMGTPEQKERFFSIFADRSALHYGAYALTEPGAGTDASGIQTTAVKDGKNYILNGTKCFITNGAKADWVVVFATVDRAAGRAGQRAFVVERGTAGFSVGKIEKKMGLRASETAELVLADCCVSAENLLGGEAFYEARGKGGFVGAMQTFDATRPVVGIMAVGIGRAALELAQTYFQENYLTTRPIGRYHLIAETLAQNVRRVHAARLLCWQAAYLADMGRPNTKEASMAKAAAAQAATVACRDALQIVGASATVCGALIEKLFRDIKVYDIFEGTAQAQRIVISKRIIETLANF